MKKKRKENIIRGKELRRLMKTGYSQKDALEMYNDVTLGVRQK